MQALELDRPADLSPGLSRLRRDLVERCRARLSECADSVAARYRHELAPYAETAPHVDVAALRRLARVNIEMLLAAVEDGNPLHDGIHDESAVEPLLVSGLPPAAILSAREAATAAVWRLVSDEITQGGLDADTSAQILTGVGATLFEVSARRGGELRRRLGFEGNGSGYRPTDELRRDVFNALLVSPHLGERTLRHAAERVGYHLSEAHIVALLAWDNGFAGHLPMAGELVSLFGEFRLGATDPIVESRGTEVVAIYPVRNGGPRRRLVDRLGSTLRNAASNGRKDAIVAVGGVEAGVSGIAVSYEQARRALDAAHATANVERAVSYPEMLPALLLLESPGLAADLRRATIEPLLVHDIEQGSDLVATLRAMVYERGNASAAAKRMHVHRHTLASRQERIERLTGLKLRSPRDLLLLELGLKTLELHPAEPRPTDSNGKVPEVVRLRPSSRSGLSVH